MIGVTYLRVVFIQFEGIQQVCYTQHITGMSLFVFKKEEHFNFNIRLLCNDIFFILKLSYDMCYYICTIPFIKLRLTPKMCYKVPSTK